MQIDELHKMSALMGPPTMETWPEGVMLGIGMGFSFVPQQPIPLQLMVRSRQYPTVFYLHMLNKWHTILSLPTDDELLLGVQ